MNERHFDPDFLIGEPSKDHLTWLKGFRYAVKTLNPKLAHDLSRELLQDQPVKRYYSQILQRDTAEAEIAEGRDACYITIPEEVVQTLALSEGDQLEWIFREDGSLAVHLAEYRCPEWLEEE